MTTDGRDTTWYKKKIPVEVSLALLIKINIHLYYYLNSNYNYAHAVTLILSISDTSTYKVGAFVVAVYQGVWYVAKVLGVEDGEVHLTFMSKSNTKSMVTYKWPRPEDDLWVKPCDIVMEIEPPMAIGRSQRAYTIPDETVKRIESVFGL